MVLSEECFFRKTVRHYSTSNTPPLTSILSPTNSQKRTQTESIEQSRAEVCFTILVLIDRRVGQCSRQAGKSCSVFRDVVVRADVFRNRVMLLLLLLLLLLPLSRRCPVHCFRHFSFCFLSFDFSISFIFLFLSFLCAAIRFRVAALPVAFILPTSLSQAGLTVRRDVTNSCPDFRARLLLPVGVRLVGACSAHERLS